MKTKITTEFGSDDTGRWAWFKINNCDIVGVSQRAKIDRLLADSDSPYLTWANQWKLALGEASIEQAELMIEALRQAVELARAWNEDAGKPIKEVLLGSRKGATDVQDRN